LIDLNHLIQISDLNKLSKKSYAVLKLFVISMTHKIQLVYTYINIC